jgi:sterol desaturase/sphingolipid hydroxylase (fatty acid hydroxylase superfamily)
MTQFAYAYVFMLVMILAEVAISQYRHRKQTPWVEMIANLNSGHLVMLLFRNLEIAAFAFLLTYCNLHWVDQLPLVWQWIFGFIAWDFCFYWMHRLHHKIPLLWAVHHVHHQGEEFNLTLAVRNSWYSSLTNFPFVAPLAVIGLPLDIFIVVSSIHYTIQFYNHNGLIKKSGFLDRIMVTPANHRVHHGLHPLYIDKNFGGTFLWDKIFGSYQEPREDIDNSIGLKTGIPSHNPVWFNHAPLVKWIKQKFPAENHIELSQTYIGFAGVALFILSIYYIYVQAMVAVNVQWSLFAGLFLGMFFIGGMSDKRPWGLVGWILFCLIFPCYTFFWLEHRDPLLIICLPLLVLSAISGAGYLKHLIAEKSAPIVK